MNISIISILVSILIFFGTYNLDDNTNQIECMQNDTCSCIAAGGCVTFPGSSCRIIFCDGEVQSSNFNSKADNITVIEQLCPGD